MWTPSGPRQCRGRSARDGSSVTQQTISTAQHVQWLLVVLAPVESIRHICLIRKPSWIQELWRLKEQLLPGILASLQGRLASCLLAAAAGGRSRWQHIKRYPNLSQYFLQKHHSFEWCFHFIVQYLFLRDFSQVIHTGRFWHICHYWSCGCHFSTSHASFWLHNLQINSCLALGPQHT